MLEFSAMWAWLLLPLPVLVYFFLPHAKDEDRGLRTPFYERIKHLQQGVSNTRPTKFNALRLLILAIIWFFLIASLANPIRSGQAVPLSTEARDLMLAMDISGSMSTADMRVQNEQLSRIIVVKYILGEFLEKRKGDRVGLILFGTNAYLQAPLTFDLKTVNTFLKETTLRLAGERTAIGDAIGLAVKRLKDRPESQRVLILLTDGENTAGNIEPRQAADLAAQAGVKIYTVGVGAESMQVSRGFFGGTRNVNPSAELDEATLEYIASTTGGAYFRARNPEELQLIYDQLDELEPIEQDEALFRPVQSLYYYPLTIAFALSLLYYFVFRIRPIGGVTYV